MALRILLLSNGHGEDAIAAGVARHLLGPDLPAGADVQAFPLVGTGSAYEAAGIPVVGVRQRLPSGGFARLGPAQFWSDVRAGMAGLIWRQARWLRRAAAEVDAAVAVGDMVPLLLAAWSLRRRIAFLPTAKSDYIGEHLAIERWWMRRYSSRVFPRDERTARSLARHGVPARHLGNVMMDLIPEPEGPLPIPERNRLIALLPGSRADAADNLLQMLAAVAVLAEEEAARDPGWSFAAALAPGLDREAIERRAEEAGWRRMPGGLQRGGAAVLLLEGAFGAVLRRAVCCIGLAGTANEQAVGLGKPVVAFPGNGVQFTPRFLAAQKRLLGDGLLAVPAEPRAVAAAVRRAVEDPQLRRRALEAGRERMGGPGGAARIAAELKSLWGWDRRA